MKLPVQNGNSVSDPTFHTKYIILPNFIKQLATTILGEAYCYEEIIESLNFTNVPCLKLGLSKGLGLGIVIGGCIVKLPQLYNILKAKSTKGVSFTSYLFETLAYLIVIGYNMRKENAFSTWGEAVCISIQNLLVLGLMLYYKKKIMLGMGIVLSSIGLLYLFCYLLSESMLTGCFLLTIPIILLSRIPQIWLIYQSKKVGQLSISTTFFYCLGTAARVFTTIQEIEDGFILLGNALAFAVNFLLFYLVIYYTKKNKSLKSEKYI
ncbi:mannose-P-dolichol utilization defect 1 protein [Neoconidiobolus thromboides FSU 785]|nr:mannose-P-dolichol utilization defect 1 protein [Neoconidiobolus thromboides FSU 785]